MRSGAWSAALTALADGVSPVDRPALWTPAPGPQTDAFNCEADELFYGGQAGGGKSDLLLGLAIEAHRKSAIFRREFPQSSDLMDRAEEIVGVRGRLRRGSPGRLSMPGRQITFGSCPHESNKLRWQGRPHDLKGFDEVTHFTRSIFVFLKTWNRSAEPGQKSRVVATGNPPTNAEGAWVVEYWAPWLDPNHPDPAAPGELRWFVTTRDGKTDTAVDGPEPIDLEGEVVHPRSRTFIPARLEDNPYLSDDDDYLAVIQSLPEPLRSQMLYGSFASVQADDDWQVIPSEWYDLAVLRWESRTEAVLPLSAVGVDVARGGADATMIAPLYGERFGELEETPGVETPSGRDVAQLVVGVTSRSSVEVQVGIDVIGVGSSPYDILVEAEAAVHGINFGAGADGETDRSGKYKLGNVRAAAYWKFREALDPEYSRIELPPDRALRAELLSPKWYLRAGRIWIEEKDAIKARLGHSPDRADAVTLAWRVRDRSGDVAW